MSLRWQRGLATDENRWAQSAAQPRLRRPRTPLEVPLMHNPHYPPHVGGPCIRQLSGRNTIGGASPPSPTLTLTGIRR